MKFLGKHPCPECLVKKDDIWKMGTKLDMATRIKKARTDDQLTRDWLQTIRNWIYRQGHTPEDAAVKRTPTHSMSLTTTQVGLSLILSLHVI